MAIYLDEAIRSHSVEDKIEGKEAIQKFFEDWMDENTFTDMDDQIEDVMIDGDLGVIITTFTATVQPKDGSEPYNMNGNGLGVFKRQDNGSWKNAYVMLN